MLLEEKILEKLDTTHLNEIDRERMHYGLKLVLSELKKLLIIYSVAFLLDCILTTFIIHLSFYLLRQVSYGFHFPSYLSCILISILAFPVSAFLINYTVFTVNKNLFVLLLLFLVIYLIGPIGTKKHPILNAKHKKHLKNKIVFRLLIVTLLYLLLPETLSLYILLGVIIQFIFLTIQLLKVRVKL